MGIGTPEQEKTEMTQASIEQERHERLGKLQELTDQAFLKTWQLTFDEVGSKSPREAQTAKAAIIEKQYRIHAEADKKLQSLAETGTTLDKKTFPNNAKDLMESIKSI